MYATFRKDVDPGVFSGGVEGGGGEGVDSICGVCEATGCERVRCFEGVRGRVMGRRRSGKRLGGEEADCLCYCRLEKTAVD